MNGKEYLMDGGVESKDGDRTDFYLKECGPGVNEGEGIPLTLDLTIVTGNGTFTITEIAPNDVVRIGNFLKSVAREVIHAKST